VPAADGTKLDHASVTFAARTDSIHPLRDDDAGLIVLTRAPRLPPERLAMILSELQRLDIW
jgi:hypothetical protein